MAKTSAKHSAKGSQQDAGKPSGGSDASSQAKILRIGVIQAGKIVEERLVRRKENVTIGASSRNTIVVPASALPRSFTLFELSGDSYALMFSETMDGRVSVNNQVLALEQIRQNKLAEDRGKGLLRLPLTESSRGKVMLGEVTLLFQFVAPPPIQPRPQLPPSVRGGLVTNIDWLLTGCYASVAVVLFTALLIMKSIEIDMNAESEELPDNFAEFLPTVQQKVAPKIDLSKIGKEGEEKVEKKEVVKQDSRGGGDSSRNKAKKAPPCDEACQRERAEARRKALAEQVARMGALKLLGTTGEGAGAAANLLSSGDPGSDADRAFQNVGGLTTSGRGGGQGLGKGGSGTGSSVGIDDLAGRVGGPGSVGTGGMVQEKMPKAIVKQSEPEIEGTLDSDRVAMTIRRGMAAVTTCYQRALKRNPKLGGKIGVRIMINAVGRVTGVEIDSDSMGDSQVTACIQSYVMRWRFPAPEGGPAEVAVPFVFQSAE